MRVLLISTYELGRQPFGLASPAAWLARSGAAVACLDLPVQPLDEALVAEADLIAFYLPMHTATRLAAAALERVRRLNPGAHLCCYGLYAPMNEAYLRHLGVQTILGGEFEAGLAALVTRLSTTGARQPSAQPVMQPEPVVSLARQQFLTPDRSLLPPLDRYAYLTTARGERRVSGYTEASRGCKHRCRHCPIVPVYGGRFRVVQREVVLADIAQQVAAGARHITFGDPDFFNGPGHAIPLVRALHERWPELSYDVTIKVEHLLAHAALLPVLRETGCALVTSAVESVDDAVLARLEKRHTRADVYRAVALCREAGLALNPTFVTFTPWTTPASYLDLLATLLELDLVEHVAPVQYAIRLLIPAGSRLLELAEVRALVSPFDQAALCYPWTHPDPAVDRLYAEALAIVKHGLARGQTRAALFDRVWQAAASLHDAPHRLAPDIRPVPRGRIGPSAPSAMRRQSRSTQPIHVRPVIPHLSEAWYC